MLLSDNVKKKRLCTFAFSSLILNGLIAGVYPLLALSQEYSPLFAYILSYVGAFFASMLHVLAFAFCITEQRKKSYKTIVLYASLYAGLAFLRLFSLSVIEYSYMLDIKEMRIAFLLTALFDALIELAFVSLSVIVCTFALKIKKARALEGDSAIAFCSIVGALVFFVISAIELTVNVLDFIRNEALGIVYTSEVYSIILDYADLLFVLLISVFFASFIQRRLEKKADL